MVTVGLTDGGDVCDVIVRGTWLPDAMPAGTTASYCRQI